MRFRDNQPRGLYKTKKRPYIYFAHSLNDNIITKNDKTE